MDEELIGPKAIVDKAIALAGRFYEMHGYTHRPGFKYWESLHPQERMMFDMAVEAIDYLTATEVWECISELEEDGLL